MDGDESEYKKPPIPKIKRPKPIIDTASDSDSSLDDYTGSWDDFLDTYGRAAFAIVVSLIFLAILVVLFLFPLVGGIKSSEGLRKKYDNSKNNTKSKSETNRETKLQTDDQWKGAIASSSQVGKDKND